MEIYSYKLKAADRKSSLKFKEIEEEYHLFTSAADNCNNGVSFKRDGKRISIDEITDNIIKISLFSEQVLSSPTRTLSAFSRELLRLDKETKILADSVYNHTLFSVEKIEYTLPENKSLEDIPDSTYLKVFIDMIFSGEKSEDLNNIKQILLKHCE